ncbi:MAG: glutamate racemase [Marinomonas sp.]
MRDTAISDPSAPILLLDTGVGGLTVLSEVRKALPDAPLIYAADMAGMPYGKKTEAEVAARVAGLLGRMSERYAPRLACIACNTASTIALGMVREVLEIPVVGTVPAIKPAALSSKTGVIGMLGTAGTVRQPYVDRLEAEFVTSGKLLRYAAPDLVDEAENKLRGKPVNRGVLKAALEGLTHQSGGMEIDRIVLGCTHFPLLADELMQVAVNDLGMNAGLEMVDGAAGIARHIAHLLDGQSYDGARGSLAVTTGELAPFEQLAPLLDGYGITRIERF